MISCCHVAIVLAIANIISLAVFAGYTVHLRLKQLVLERKNGKEQDQINQLKKQLRILRNALSTLPKEKDPS